VVVKFHEGPPDLIPFGKVHDFGFEVPEELEHFESVIGEVGELLEGVDDVSFDDLPVGVHVGAGIVFVAEDEDFISQVSV
jgi:hypothetical protein